MHEPEPPAAGPITGEGGRISSILEALPRAVQGDRISFGDLVDAFQHRAYGPLIVVFAAPNMLPVALPGISAVLGAPLILLTAQLMLGRDRPWLPGFLRRRSLARASFEGLVARIVPRIGESSRWSARACCSSPECSETGDRRARAGARAASSCCRCRSATPCRASRSSVMSIGLLGRDGLAVLAGGLIGVAGLVIASGFVYGAMLAGLALVRGGIGV